MQTPHEGLSRAARERIAARAQAEQVKGARRGFARVLRARSWRGGRRAGSVRLDAAPQIELLTEPSEAAEQRQEWPAAGSVVAGAAGMTGASKVASPYIAQALRPAMGGFDRFQMPGLKPVDSGQRTRFIRREDRGPKTKAEKVPKTGAARWLDRGLLALEIAGALVVAWLAFQYIYTVYFDTGPRRVSPGIATQSTSTASARASATAGAGAVATKAATATPTRFVEVLPPMTGEGEGSGSGAPDAAPTLTLPVTPTATATATATPSIPAELLLPARLRIPVMFLDSPVHEVTVNMGEWEVSPMDIGHHEGTADPGQVGNVVLAGHRDINSALFRELDRLQPGDDVFVSNGLGEEFRYIVQESMVVAPSATEVMDPTPDKRVTLITCTPIGLATQRLVVVATLDEGHASGSGD